MRKDSISLASITHWRKVKIGGLLICRFADLLICQFADLPICWFADLPICWCADLQGSHWRKDTIGRLLIWRLTLHCWEGGKQANKLQRCLFSKHLEKLQKEFVQQTPSKSVKENVELPLLRRKLDQTNFLFYPTEDKVSPPLPSISPLDSLWKTNKAKEREFLTRVWTLTCEWTAG